MFLHGELTYVFESDEKNHFTSLIEETPARRDWIQD